MGNSFEMKLPMHIETGVRKKVKHYLNLNKYRNLQAETNNNQKKAFKKLIWENFPKDTFYELYELEYTLFLPDKRKRDISNVCCVVDKYFNDALSAKKIVKDDNYYFLQKVTYKLGGYDPDEEGYVMVKVVEVLENINMEDKK